MEFKKSKHLNRPIFFYYLFVFLASWLMWLPGLLYTYKLIPSIRFLQENIEIMNWLGGMIPSLIAFILIYKKHGLDGCKNLFMKLFKLRLGYWYIPIFLIVPAVVYSAHVLNVYLFGAEFPQTGLLAQPLWIPVVFIIFFIFQFSEEFGWRGYALEHLQKKFNALSSSLIVGTLWAVWHIPMFLSQGFPHHDYQLPFVQLFVTLVLASIIMTWLINNCNGSLFPAFILHAFINISGEVLPLIEKSTENQGDYRVWIITNLLLSATVLIILVIWGPRSLKRKT